jgi:hypothetical protein
LIENTAAQYKEVIANLSSLDDLTIRIHIDEKAEYLLKSEE